MSLHKLVTRLYITPDHSGSSFLSRHALPHSADLGEGLGQRARHVWPSSRKSLICFWKVCGCTERKWQYFCCVFWVTVFVGRFFSLLEDGLLRNVYVEAVGVTFFGMTSSCGAAQLFFIPCTDKRGNASNATSMLHKRLLMKAQKTLKCRSIASYPINVKAAI